MRDIDVRKALSRDVFRRHEGQPDTLIVHELGLRHGIARVDVAVVNGMLHGYEIKSDRDTLDRLPAQIAVYGTVLDKATLVVGHRHAKEALRLLPSWWGIKLATEGPRGAVHLSAEQPAQQNPALDPVAVAELLWSTEAAQALRTLGYPEKELRQARSYLYRELTEALSLKELRAVVRQALKNRETWRDQQPPELSGDS